MALSVLVVDDSPMARRMLVNSLPAGLAGTVGQACSGVEAVAAYRKGGVDLMFLDLTMPEMDGYEVLEILRREDMNCMVIVVSADIQPLAQERVLAMGALAFIKKPVNTAKLEEVLREYGVLTT